MRNVKYSGCLELTLQMLKDTRNIWTELLRKPSLKPQLTPAGFPEQLQKLLIDSYKRQLMIVNMVTVHRRGTHTLSNEVSFIAAYTFPSLFSPSSASALSPLSCSVPVFHHVFTCYSALFFPPPPQCLLSSHATLLPRSPSFSWLPLSALACSLSSLA